MEGLLRQAPCNVTRFRGVPADYDQACVVIFHGQTAIVFGTLHLAHVLALVGDDRTATIILYCNGVTLAGRLRCLSQRLVDDPKS